MITNLDASCIYGQAAPRKIESDLRITLQDLRHFKIFAYVATPSVICRGAGRWHLGSTDLANLES
ncbi:MAG: hypothetical protein ACREQ3_27385, partial [Candidatus Binatia bacterium]